jgi:hypothetical protein
MTGTDLDYVVCHDAASPRQLLTSATVKRPISLAAASERYITGWADNTDVADRRVVLG